MRKLIARMAIILIIGASLFTLVCVGLCLYGKRYIPQMDLKMFVTKQDGSLYGLSFGCFQKPPEIKVLRFRQFHFHFTHNNSKAKEYYLAFVYEGRYVVKNGSMRLKIIWSPFYKNYVAFIEH